MLDIRFVYIASPYTLGDPALNVRKSLECAEELIAAGYVPFTPLLSHLWHLMSPHPYEFWTALDMAWLERCDALIRLPGESKGADREASAMRQMGKPVFFSVAHLKGGK